jgi:uncharacterized NAD(P)/FAD-binding protein YdhS
MAKMETIRAAYPGRIAGPANLGQVKRVVIVGTGASGTLTAINLLRRSEPGALELTMIGDERPGSGAAYTTTFPRHLLNVPAAKMSALVEEPNHFLSWLQTTHHGYEAGDFAPRMVYGDYLRDTLAEATTGTNLEVVSDRVVRIDGGRVYGDAGLIAEGDVVVLTTGHARHRPIWDGVEFTHPGLAADPFGPLPAPRTPDSRALVIGAGLTAVDVALRLKDSGFTHIELLSRTGAMPKSHAPHGVPSVEPPASLTESPDIDALESWLVSGEWRGRMDGLRPHTQRLWRALSDAEQARFLRDKQRGWNVLRHRMAPRIAAEIEAMLLDSTLSHPRGHLGPIEEVSDGLLAITIVRADGAQAAHEVELVVDATGTGRVVTEAAKLDPLWRQLIDDGIAQPGPHGLGVHTEADGRLIPREGETVVPLYTMGGLRVGELWESTAVPELRVQASELADTVLRL